MQLVLGSVCVRLETEGRNFVTGIRSLDHVCAQQLKLFVIPATNAYLLF